MTVVEAAPYPPQPKVVELPSGAWDTHVHVFGPQDRFPQAPSRAYSAPAQDVDRLLDILDAAGVASAVVVQPSVYQRDNSCLLDAVSQAPDRLVGVVDIVIDDSAAGSLAELHERGVRGFRFRPEARPSGEAFDRLDRECARLGWHISVCLDDIAELTEWETSLARTACPIVIEGMGQPRGVDLLSRGFLALKRLLESPDVYVKLSHFYNVAPYTRTFEACRPIVEALAAHAPDRLVWGSDWPHPMLHPRVMPHYGELLALLQAWIGDVLFEQILVSNPQAVFATSTVPLSPTRVPAHPQGES